MGSLKQDHVCERPAGGPGPSTDLGRGK